MSDQPQVVKCPHCQRSVTVRTKPRDSHLLEAAEPPRVATCPHCNKRFVLER